MPWDRERPCQRSIAQWLTESRGSDERRREYIIVGPCEKSLVHLCRGMRGRPHLAARTPQCADMWEGLRESAEFPTGGKGGGLLGTFGDAFSG
jgi:hypothetical protein